MVAATDPPAACNHDGPRRRVSTRALVRTREAMRAGMSHTLDVQLNLERNLMQELRPNISHNHRK